MNLLIYGLAAVAAGVLAIRVPLADRDDPLRWSFSLVTLLLGLGYLGFTLYLLPGLTAFKYLHAAAFAFLPAAFLHFIDRLLGGSTPDPRIRRLAGTALPVVALCVTLDALLWYDVPRASKAEITLALFIGGSFYFPLERLGVAWRTATRRVERARLGYLLTLALLAFGTSSVEAIARSLTITAVSEVTFWTRPVVLQGPMPPIGTVFASILIVFLHQIVTVRRLPDLNEIFARLATVGIAGALLVTIEVVWVASVMSAYPVHSALHVFMAAGLFLLVYDPLRVQLEAWLGALISQRVQRLETTLREIDSALPRALSMEDLSRELLGRLVESGRVRSAALYLWDDERRAFRLVAERGRVEQPALVQVSFPAFTDGFERGENVYLRDELEQRSERDPRQSEEMGRRLQALDAMNADVVLPMRSADVLLGWLALRDEHAADGFSEVEAARMARTVAHASALVENLYGFEKLKEMHRLAALGTMAAGLAHEIRNPLAAIKGAAQFLQTGGQTGPEAEMAGIIVDEVNRLNGVVSQFLDYARPFTLHREDVDVNVVTSGVLGMLRAQGLPSGVTTQERLRTIPRVSADPARIKQVLLNLCQNALQAMKTGGTLTVRTAVGTLRDPKRPNAQAVEIAVEDTGCGIPPEAMDKLFVPFYTTRSDGTGLGLPICQRIVQAHDGELDLISTPGKGTVFTVRLPLVSAE